MKTVVLKVFVNNAKRIINTGNYNAKQKLTDSDIQDFRIRVIPTTKINFVNDMKHKYLPAGGFIYGGDLYVWSENIAENGYEYQLWATVTFEDTNNVGKQNFMNMIKRTGLLSGESDTFLNALITKNYS